MAGRKGSLGETSIGKEFEDLFGDQSGGIKKRRPGDTPAPKSGEGAPKPKPKPKAKESPTVQDGAPSSPSPAPEPEEEEALIADEKSMRGCDLDPGLAMMLRDMQNGKSPSATSYNLANQSTLGLISLAIKRHTSPGIKVNNTQILERLVEMAKQELLARGTKSKVFKCLITEIEKAG